jgi:hypothetical protein
MEIRGLPVPPGAPAVLKAGPAFPARSAKDRLLMFDQIELTILKWVACSAVWALLCVLIYINCVCAL